MTPQEAVRRGIATNDGIAYTRSHPKEWLPFAGGRYRHLLLQSRIEVHFTAQSPTSLPRGQGETLAQAP